MKIAVALSPASIKNHYNQYFVDQAEDDEPFYAKLMYHYLLNSTQYTLIHYLIKRPQMTLTQLCLVACQPIAYVSVDQENQSTIGKVSNPNSNRPE